jgi:hypothetical protein
MNNIIKLKLTLLAQCWVYSGALNTVARTLGIPARQITNFGSAHEQAKYGKYRY